MTFRFSLISIPSHLRSTNYWTASIRLGRKSLYVRSLSLLAGKLSVDCLFRSRRVRVKIEEFVHPPQPTVITSTVNEDISIGKRKKTKVVTRWTHECAGTNQNPKSNHLSAVVQHQPIIPSSIPRKTAANQEKAWWYHQHYHPSSIHHETTPSSRFLCHHRRYRHLCIIIICLDLRQSSSVSIKEE